jgi:hypothetical protein
VSLGQTRGQQGSGHADDRQDPQHGWHSSGEATPTQHREPTCPKSCPSSCGEVQLGAAGCDGQRETASELLRIPRRSGVTRNS